MKPFSHRLFSMIIVRYIFDYSDNQENIPLFGEFPLFYLGTDRFSDFEQLLFKILDYLLGFSSVVTRTEIFLLYAAAYSAYILWFKLAIKGSYDYLICFSASSSAYFLEFFYTSNYSMSQSKYLKLQDFYEIRCLFQSITFHFQFLKQLFVVLVGLVGRVQVILVDANFLIGEEILFFINATVTHILSLNIVIK